ncbi:hypothetical protein M378DRAFT_9465 [Amanita muscaria Koide BX008]|uniref:Nephrocystin 3-like N-terminal domain-containing protein n=1 Tax=Amanita muscaria (strain Koide BX008) TaxID=946122 RepID=A0A0C2WZF0_AMAMK|nr:hypothetical protein M378DRAFT_9465 [Amanita muscaria Koide BX008]
MDSTGSETLHLSILQSAHTNNQDNYGIIGNGSNNFVNSGNITINMDDELEELHRLLRHFTPETFSMQDVRNSPLDECHPNTRTTVRDEIGDWVDESESKKSPLLWLNGPAAVGKSVIAKTISRSYNQIVAVFFFSTGSDRPVATLVPALAWQLALSVPETREHIIASLKNNASSLQMSQIKEQFDLLIIQPLKSATLMFRPVMVIDGVDECTKEDMMIILRFLRVIVEAGEAGDMPVRFIICSRPDPRIHAILGKVRDVNPTTNEQEPGVVSKSSGTFRAIILSIVSIAAISSIVIIALLAAIVLPEFSARRSEAIVLMPFVISLAVFAVLAVIVLITEAFGSYRPTSEVHLHSPIQRSQSFLQGVSELYKLIPLDVEKDAPLSATSGGLADVLDRICSHRVVSTIQIGSSEESKKDIAIYLTNKFKETLTRLPGESTSPWFQQLDISRLVKASDGQFLFATIIVRLLEDSQSHSDPRDFFEMVRRGYLPTGDLDDMYESVLKRAYDSIRNRRRQKMEQQLLKEVLGILVFFAGNVHFFTERKNLPVIETLLGLESGKLALKLNRMHSVLRIVPGETIQVHHRSFLEFLQDRERSGEYHISYSYGLRRFLILLTRAGFRFIDRRSE